MHIKSYLNDNKYAVFCTCLLETCTIVGDFSLFLQHID